MSVALPVVAGLVGIVLGALLTRRNARRDHADKLLADALNDLVSAIAEVANGDQQAQRRYASSTSRIVLHGSPALVAAFREFQTDPTTGSSDGRRRLVKALQAARQELGREPVDEEAAALLLFGVNAA